MLFKRILGYRVLSISLLIVICGCAKTELLYYQSTIISPENRVTNSNYRNFRSGHLLIKGNGSVIELYTIYENAIHVRDDESCHSSRIEIPPFNEDNLPLPLVVNNPKAYLQVCSCTWGGCVEEPLKEGKVTVLKVENDAVLVELHLIFPSETIRKIGLFQGKDPRWILIADDSEIPAEIKSSWKVLHIE